MLSHLPSKAQILSPTGGNLEQIIETLYVLRPQHCYLAFLQVEAAEVGNGRHSASVSLYRAA